MLDGIQTEKKAYKAVKEYEYAPGKTSKLTINFTAFNVEEALRFLEDGGYKEYKLVVESK